MADSKPTLPAALEAEIRREGEEHRAEIRKIFDGVFDGAFDRVFQKLEENNRKLRGIVEQMEQLGEPQRPTRPALRLVKDENDA
jgi:hypothetical protein